MVSVCTLGNYPLSGWGFLADFQPAVSTVAMQSLKSNKGKEIKIGFVTLLLIPINKFYEFEKKNTKLEKLKK